MNALIDLVEQRFGRLVVIKRVENNRHKQVKWLCKCDCGKETIVIGNNLKRHTTRSCGCLHIPDLKGQRYGRLVVAENVERPMNLKNTNAYWKCQCDCGNTIVVSASNLRRGICKSCGCLRVELIREMAKRVNRIEFGKSAFNRIYYDYKRGAKRKNVEFNLSEEYFKSLVIQNCHYCGIEPKRTIKVLSGNGDYICNGIDRVDNLKGYVIGNVVACCRDCNQSKNNRSIYEFLDWAKRLYNHSIKQKGFDGI